MAIFYKIKEDGKAVYVLKTLSNHPKRKMDDVVGFKEISVEKFLSKIPTKVKNSFEKEIEKVQKIHEKNIFYINRINVYIPEIAVERVVFNINGKVFNIDWDDYGQKQEMNEALGYCSMTYGSEFASKYRYIFNGKDTENYTFADNELISSSEASRLAGELLKLTKAQNLKEKIEYYQNKKII